MKTLIDDSEKQTVVNLLLVDDQPNGLVALEAMLSAPGRNLMQARSGREALKHAMEKEFAVILLDVQMPVMDGFELAALIRERERLQHTPIIFLTAGSISDAAMSKAYSLGAVDFVHKPIAKEILSAKVSVFVELARKTELLKRQASELEELVAVRAKLVSDLEDRNSKLETVNRDLEAFSYSVSHDLRAPLRGVIGFSRILEEQLGENSDPGVTDALTRISRAATKMGELIDGLLSLARLSRQEMRVGVVDLSAMARGIAEELKKAEPARDVRWSIPEKIEVRGDRQLLQIVLQNLLSNAWKYSSKKSDARIELGVDRIDGVTTYLVRDNGAGFNAKYSENLFRVFQRLHSAEEFEGIGIGLATVQRIVQRHGGKIWADGRVNQGATFYFTLGMPV
ncbi:MAG: response regulator [Deltaproteobacteria bacterium]|nr:response regulator [Deltaproteobacteria bacterium]